MKSNDCPPFGHGCSPAPLLGITRVKAMNILGVALRDDLKAADHVDTIIASSSRSLYAFRLLRAQGLPSPARYLVTTATSMTRMTYAALAWWGLTSANDKKRLERFKNKLTRFGYLQP